MLDERAMIQEATEKAQALVSRLESDIDGLCASRRPPTASDDQVQTKVESTLTAALHVLAELQTVPTDAPNPTESNS